MNLVNVFDDIVALSTPYSKSALAIVRVSGPNSHQKFNVLLAGPEKPPSLTSPDSADNTSSHSLQFTPKKILIKTLSHPHTQQVIDKAVIIPYNAPHSYTGQNMLEIIIHGGIPAIDLLLDALTALEFRYADAGEFSKRAFFNHKMDLTQVEAVQQIIEAPSLDSHLQSVAQLGGTLSTHIETIKKDIMSLASKCAVSIDYPEEEISEIITLDPHTIDTVIAELQQLILSYSYAQKKKEGITVAIIGQPNAGKSSLFNALCREERAIVSSKPGTTRDYLDITVHDSTVNLRLFDTAGLRSDAEEIEHLGIERSYEIVAKADLLVYVIAADKGIDNKDQKLIAHCQKINTNNAECVFVLNKFDLIETNEVIKINETPTSANIPLRCSSFSQKSVDAVLKELFIKAQAQLPSHQSPVIVQSLRQRNYFEQCLEAMAQVRAGVLQNQPLDMISLDLDDALRALGAVTGEVSADDVLDVVFSTFCVGK